MTNGAATALTSFEKGLAVTLYAILLAAIAWLVQRVDRMDDKRETAHSAVMEKLDKGDAELTKAVHELQLEQARTTTLLETLKDRAEQKVAKK
jgi:preprotein translocase subunit YajC